MHPVLLVLPLLRKAVGLGLARGGASQAEALAQAAEQSSFVLLEQILDDAECVSRRPAARARPQKGAGCRYQDFSALEGCSGMVRSAPSLAPRVSLTAVQAEGLEAVCEVRGAGAYMGFRLDPEKLMGWLVGAAVRRPHPWHPAEARRRLLWWNARQRLWSAWRCLSAPVRRTAPRCWPGRPVGGGECCGCSLLPACWPSIWSPLCLISFA